MEGLKYLKAGQPEMSIEHLNLAKSFDKKSSKIYVAKGCALANLVNILTNRITFIKASEKSSKLLNYPRQTKRHLNIKKK